MTVLGTEQPYAQYTGTGERVFFEYGFTWNGETVFVEVNGVPVTFTQQSTGVVLDTAPALDDFIVIYRLTDITQETDFQPFESFPGKKTEDAVDKLILLKQEAAIFRADLNLYADQPVAWTDLVNDKGSTPRIFLWNEDMSGVFSGEVTTKMPNAGTYVLHKPEDFAYFQYGDSPVLTQQVTSTLYPIEIIEEIDISATLESAYMNDIDSSSQSWSMDVVASEIAAVKIDYGPDTDTQSWTQDILAAEKFTTRINYGPDTDTQSWTQDIVAAEKLPGKVDAFNPDEELDIVAFLSTTDCYMVDA